MTIEHGLTAEDLAKLSPEERAALTDDLSDDKTTHATKSPKKSTNNNPDPADPVLGGAAASTEIVQDAGGNKTPSDEADPEPPAPEPVAVPYTAPAASIDMEAVKEKLGSLAKQFEDGELTLQEYQDRRDAIRDAVNTAKIKAEIGSEHEYQVDEALWMRDVADFLDRHKAYDQDPLLKGFLDQRVKELAAVQENQNWTNRKILEEAHKEIAKRFNVGSAPAAPSDPKRDLARARQPDFSGVPPAVGFVPSAGNGDASAGEFDAIERAFSEGRQADGERLLARLTPEQQDRYAMGAA